MRAMEAELSMYKQQVDLFKSDIEAANEGMRELRHRWVAEQRRSKGNNGREGGGSDGADETVNISASSGGRSPSPVGTVAASSAQSMPSMLQDRKETDGAPVLENSLEQEGQIPEGSGAGSPGAAAAP